MSEEVLDFRCKGEQLIGILHRPHKARKRAVLVVVGGPQTRVGSHRQFVLLARSLADQGYPCLRFDYRGMGDSTGAMRDFQGIDDDIQAALDALLDAVPEVEDVALWGELVSTAATARGAVDAVRAGMSPSQAFEAFEDLPSDIRARYHRALGLYHLSCGEFDISVEELTTAYEMAESQLRLRSSIRASRDRSARDRSARNRRGSARATAP